MMGFALRSRDLHPGLPDSEPQVLCMPAVLPVTGGSGSGSGLGESEEENSTESHSSSVNQRPPGSQVGWLWLEGKNERPPVLGQTEDAGAGEGSEGWREVAGASCWASQLSDFEDTDPVQGDLNARRERKMFIRLLK